MTEAERERLSPNLAEIIPLQAPSRTTGGARHKRNVTSEPHPHENHQPTRNDPRPHAFTQRPSTGRPNTSLECHPSPAQDLATGRGCKCIAALSGVDALIATSPDGAGGTAAMTLVACG